MSAPPPCGAGVGGGGRLNVRNAKVARENSPQASEMNRRRETLHRPPPLPRPTRGRGFPSPTG
jgi:hypothetical protein